jgi:hypothetical protein
MLSAILVAEAFGGEIGKGSGDTTIADVHTLLEAFFNSW